MRLYEITPNFEILFYICYAINSFTILLQFLVTQKESRAEINSRPATCKTHFIGNTIIYFHSFIVFVILYECKQSEFKDFIMILRLLLTILLTITTFQWSDLYQDYDEYLLEDFGTCSDNFQHINEKPGRSIMRQNSYKNKSVLSSNTNKQPNFTDK